MAGIALAAVGTAGEAQASGYALLEQSTEAQGASYAGSGARADDPSTLFYNPAGMTRLPGYQVSLSGAFILPQAVLESGTSYAGGTTGRDAGENVLLPSLYATAQIAPDWHVGLAITSPFGLATKYDAASIARYYAQTTSLTTINIAPSVAWQPLPVLSVAAALRVEVADARLSQAVDFGSVVNGFIPGYPGYAPGRIANDGLATVKGNDAAVGWQVGLLYQPAPGTRLGFDYRSAIYHKLSGSMAFGNVPQGLPLPLQQALSATFAGGPATAKLVTPDTLSLSVAQDIGPVTLLGGVDYTLWSHFKTLMVNYTGPAFDIQENWRDTVMLSAGADWHVAADWTLRGGFAFDETPTRDANRTPRIPDANRYWLSVGATWKPIPRLALSAAYSHIFVDNSTVNLTSNGSLSAGFNNQIDILSAEATLSF
jgi:long-chain fatty acid transport protein